MLRQLYALPHPLKQDQVIDKTENLQFLLQNQIFFKQTNKQTEPQDGPGATKKIVIIETKCKFKKLSIIIEKNI